VDRGGDHATAIVRLGIVTQRPLVNGPCLLEAGGFFLAGGGGVNTLKPVSAERSGSPFAGEKFNVGDEVIATTVDAQHDRVWRAPFVHRLGVEESEKQVELAIGAGERAGSAERIIKRGVRNDLGVISCFACGGNMPAKLAGFSAGVGGAAEAEILPHG